MKSVPGAVKPAALCGVERCTGRFTWVCIKPVHDTEKQRSSQPDKRGHAPRAERHYFVNKYPNR